MENVTDVMVASMLMEASVTGDSLHKVIRDWRARGCTIPQADERAIVENFGKRSYLDALKIRLLRFVIDYEKDTVTDKDLFKNLTPVKKPDTS